MKLSIWDKIGCFIVGWDRNVLVECTPASRKTLKKYVSALTLLMVLWGFIGFQFAIKYADAPIWAACICGVVFVVIVVQIERQIILTIGKNGWLIAFRSFIALIMAVLGSVIIDNILFEKDIKSEVKELAYDKASQMRDKVLMESNDRIRSYELEVDSLNTVLDDLTRQYNRKPIVKTPVWHHTYQNVQRGDTVVRERVSEMREESRENPIKANIDRLSLSISEFQGKIDDEYKQREEKISETVSFYENNPGLLMELEAIVNIITSSWVSCLVYILFFLFFVSIELFIVISKWKEDKSDYDVLIQKRRDKKVKDVMSVMGDNE